jgi:hypothetical protein
MYCVDSLACGEPSTIRPWRDASIACSQVRKRVATTRSAKSINIAKLLAPPSAARLMKSRTRSFQSSKPAKWAEDRHPDHPEPTPRQSFQREIEHWLKTSAGKARAANNALRHGLNIPVPLDPRSRRRSKRSRSKLQVPGLKLRRWKSRGVSPRPKLMSIVFVIFAGV